jgi:hypothetical protein
LGKKFFTQHAKAKATLKKRYQLSSDILYIKLKSNEYGMDLNSLKISIVTIKY